MVIIVALSLDASAGLRSEPRKSNEEWRDADLTPPSQLESISNVFILALIQSANE